MSKAILNQFKRNIPGGLSHAQTNYSFNLNIMYPGCSEDLRNEIDLADAYRDDIREAEPEWHKWYSSEWDDTETLWDDGDRFCEVSHITGNIHIVEYY